MEPVKSSITSTPERSALRYAKLGHRVLTVWPLENGRCTCDKGKMCKTPGKHPIAKGWEKKATTDPDLISKWFRRHPNAHVGIMPQEGHCIIDVDPRNGGKETIQRLISKIPKTPIQESGGGGYHLFFDGEPDGPIGKGVDVKRYGRGFVVAWPSAHVSGGSYRWRNAPWDVEPAPLPRALQGTPRKHELTPIDDAPPSYPLDLIRTALAHIDADEYARWINIGQALRHAYGDEGQELWEQWSKTSSKYEEGDEDKWESFDQNRDRPLITIRSIMAIARRNGYRPLTPEFDNGIWAKADIADFLDAAAPKLDWVCEPCMPAGKVCLLAGAGGSSKSYLTLTLAMHLAINEPFGPFKPTKMGKTLMLVAEEDREDIWRRIEHIRKVEAFDDEQLAAIKDNVGVYGVQEEDWRMLFHDEAGDAQETDVVDNLIQEIRTIGDCRLLVVDPLVAFNGGNENDSADMAKLMFTLNRIAKSTGCCVLVVHHTNKSAFSAENGNGTTQAVVRGSSALVDNSRAVVVVQRMGRNEALVYGISEADAGRFVVCAVVKNNYGKHTPESIFAVTEGGALRHAPEVVKKFGTAKEAKKVMADVDWPLRILRTMVEDPDGTLRDWSTALNVDKSTISRHLKRMEDDKLVRRVGVGAGTTFELTKQGIKELKSPDEEDLIG